MITKFEVENFRNFKERFVFDLSEIKNYEFNSECIHNGIVNKALIYGTNSCGKSNLGFAMFDLVAHLTDKQSNPEDYRNYLNAESGRLTAEFKFSFKFGNAILEYRYGKAAIGDLAYEFLSIDGIEVIRYLFGNPFTTTLKGTETLNKDLGISSISAIKYIKNNAILEKTPTNEVFRAFLDFVDNMLFFRSLEANYYLGYQTGTDNILADILKNNNLHEFEAFLNAAGVNCQLGRFELNGKEEIAFMFAGKPLRFWDIASSGTKSLALFYYWLQRLRRATDKVSLVFMDEFDAYYHHKLSKLIVNEVKKIPAQAILTTHNTSIMSNDLLRPDCYFLMQNNKIQPIYQFTDKELRNAHNIEKMYKAGAFDG